MRFFTDTGVEVPAVTAEQMREGDRLASEATGPNLFQMMENAGRNLALLAIALLGEQRTASRIVVLAGSGGNGGGGICAARHLANRDINVRLCLAEPDRLEEVPAFQRTIFRSTQGREIDDASLSAEPVDLILDGLIGYGLRSAPRSPVADLIRWSNGTGMPILALDVPSGVDATTGHRPGDCIQPHWTMTLALPKTGLLPERTGQLFLADIGIPEQTYRRLGWSYVNPFAKGFWVPLICRS
ncbi:MAG: NAD(P)H-hydrate epimerase [Nitrospira sp. SG-bin2]|uniref:NAD(P)H-hydrate epimerase n=1 Tax=Nitrospira cf. moscoviensis SBR1015 TaxID=96242 RepID=UPI000A0C486E|nr:NAD(P)H-hydrate epimerase [Nitrospira cf. moscoviensis SBR1015]OQW35708.1 MAG: NAD(P)H-hydrate epimerase [Nitrospira sp. SG-bin2]